MIMFCYPIVSDKAIKVDSALFPNRIPAWPFAQFRQVVAEAVVVVAGFLVALFAVESCLPVAVASGGPLGEVGFEDLAFAEGLVAVAFLDRSRPVGDGGFTAHGVAEGVAGFFKGAVGVGIALAQDEVVAASGSVEVSS